MEEEKVIKRRENEGSRKKWEKEEGEDEEEEGEKGLR